MAYYVYQEDALENTASFQSKKSFITSTTVWSDLTDLKVFPIYQYLMTSLGYPVLPGMIQNTY